MDLLIISLLRGMEARCYQVLPPQVSAWRLGADRALPGPGAGCRSQDCCLGSELQQVTLPRFLRLSDDSTTYLIELTHVKTLGTVPGTQEAHHVCLTKRETETVSKGETVR